MSYCLNLVSRSSHGCTHPNFFFFCTAVSTDFAGPSLVIITAGWLAGWLAGWVWRAHASGQGTRGDEEEDAAPDYCAP